MAAEGVAVLLMAYGGPGSLDDVEPYLQDVRGGRPTAPELVAEIRSRYARIGGRSPIRERTDAQAEALGHALGPAWPVYVGMRHWHPFIQETVERIVADGQARVVAIALAPHYSALSVGAYEQKLLAAAQGRLELALVRSWGDHPKFLEAVAERVKQALQRFPAPSAVQVLFTAHSLPEPAGAGERPVFGRQMDHPERRFGAGVRPRRTGGPPTHLRAARWPGASCVLRSNGRIPLPRLKYPSLRRSEGRLPGPDP